MRSDFYWQGVTAAKDSRLAIDCPFPTGINRQEWLAGFFSVKPPK